MSLCVYVNVVFYFFDINSIDTKKTLIMSNDKCLIITACQLHVYFKAVKKCDWSTCCDDVSSRLHKRYPEMRLIYNYEELNSQGLSITMSSNDDGGFPKLNIDMISSDETYESDGEGCDEGHNALNSNYNLTHCRDYLNELYNFNLDCVENCSWPLFPSRYVYILNFAFGVNYKKHNRQSRYYPLNDPYTLFGQTTCRYLQILNGHIITKRATMNR